MVKAKDLRIGNLCLDKFGKSIIIESINHSGINLRGGDGYGVYPDFEFKEIFPIQLTEEWLLKFGFEKYDDGVFCHPKTDLAFDIVKCDFYVVGQVNTYDGTVNDAFPLRTKTKYVHQLQNLYFALTNTELTVNL